MPLTCPPCIFYPSVFNALLSEMEWKFDNSTLPLSIFLGSIARLLLLPATVHISQSSFFLSINCSHSTLVLPGPFGCPLLTFWCLLVFTLPSFAGNPLSPSMLEQPIFTLAHLHSSMFSAHQLFDKISHPFKATTLFPFNFGTDFTHLHPFLYQFETESQLDPL